MQGPELVDFSMRLAEARRTAITRVELGKREYEALLLDPGFDGAGFVRFRAGHPRCLSQRDRTRAHAAAS